MSPKCTSQTYDVTVNNDVYKYNQYTVEKTNILFQNIFALLDNVKCGHRSQ